MFDTCYKIDWAIEYISQKIKAGKKKKVCIVFTLTYFSNTEGKAVSENGNLIRFCCFMNWSERFLGGRL